MRGTSDAYRTRQCVGAINAKRLCQRFIENEEMALSHFISEDSSEFDGRKAQAKFYAVTQSRSKIL
jgi:hypothetical protein